MSDAQTNKNQIAQNVCIDYHRKQHTRAKTFSPEAVDDSLIGTDTHPCPSQLMEQKELRAILHQAVLHLPPMRRRVFQLHFVEELPIKAIAKQINRSEGTVKTHISIAHHQLRELLCPYLKNEPLQWYKKPPLPKSCSCQGSVASGKKPVENLA